MRRRLAGLLLAGLVLSIGVARAEGDRAEGEALARLWCSECHTTEATSGGSDVAPAWRSITADSLKNQAYLREFLNNPHPAMRHIPLSPRQIEDLVAYILSLGFE